MAKRIEIDGKFYRMRRSKLVLIPDRWVGKVTRPQTIRKRMSKQTHKIQRIEKTNQSGEGTRVLPEDRKAPLED